MSREAESVHPLPAPPPSGAPSADAGADAHRRADAPASPAPGMPCGFETAPDAGHA